MSLLYSNKLEKDLPETAFYKGLCKGIKIHAARAEAAGKLPWETDTIPMELKLSGGSFFCHVGACA